MGMTRLQDSPSVTTGNVSWYTDNVNGDVVRKAYVIVGNVVIANLEFTPKSGAIANGTGIAYGLPAPKYPDTTVFGGNSQQVKINAVNGDGRLVWYYPSDRTTLQRVELLLVYVKA